MVPKCQSGRVPLMVFLLLILVSLLPKVSAQSSAQGEGENVNVPSDGFSLTDFEGNPVGSGQLGLLLYNGGRVCDIGWNKFADVDPRTHNELNAVCKALGFKMGVFEGHGDDYDFKKDMDYSIYKTKCSSMDWSDCIVTLKGKEQKSKEEVEEDEYSYIPEHHCDDYTDMFIICSNGDEEKPLVEEFTLVNEDGNVAVAGEMGLLKFKGYPVSEVDVLGAQVACKMMGFEGVTHISQDDAQFNKLIDEDTTPTILRTMRCENDSWFSCYLGLTNSLYTYRVSLTCGAPNPEISCPRGTYLDTSSEDLNILVCVICEQGFSAGGRTENCTWCPRGFHAKAGAASKEDCLVSYCRSGTYIDKENNQCALCKDGTYRNGITYPDKEENCVPCPEGKTVPAGEGFEEGSCFWTGPCEAGKYLDRWEGCLDCPAHTYSPANNILDSCQPCPPGSVLPKGAGTYVTDCEWCPAGQFRTSSRGECTKCKEGTYSLGSDNNCRACPSGTTVQAGQGSHQGDCQGCPAGQFAFGNKCSNCPQNSFSLGNATECSACPTGSIVATGEGVSEESCIGCPAGQYRYNGYCRNCNTGHYREANGGAVCTKCPEGTTVETGKGTTSSDCKECPSGQYRPTYSFTCRHCADSYYREAGGGTECKRCPAGTYVAIGKGTKLSDCEDCPAGQYRYTRYNSRYCTDCDTGKYRAVGGGSYCSTCPSGTTVERGKGTNSSDCKPCPAGHYLYAYGRSCRKCSTGFYSSEGSTRCTVCPSGTSVAEGEGTKESDCKGCEAGYYLSWRTCRQCDKIYYSLGNATSCSRCPSGTLIAEGLGTKESDCTGCPAGQYLYSYYSRYSHTTYQCRNCSRGQYSEGNTTNCNRCPSGSTVAVGQGKSPSDCEFCLPGQYLDTGSYSSTNECQNCFKGYYNSGKEGSCRQCPFGTTVEAGLGQNEGNCTRGNTFQLVDSEGNSVGAGVEGLLLYRGGVVCTWVYRGRTNEKPGMAICRWLGFDRVQSTTYGSKFGAFQTNKAMELDNVRCNSADLSTCSRREKSANDGMYYSCSSHRNDVFLTCGMGCPPGDFKNSNGTCEVCPVGMFSTGNATSCSSCPAAKSVPEGTKGISLDSCQWEPCESAHYLDNTNGCIPCTAGTYSTGGKPSRCNNCLSGKTVAAGSGTQVGDCIAVGEFKAFASLNDELAGIEGKLFALKQAMQKLVGEKIEEKESSGDDEEDSGPCGAGTYSAGENRCNNCPYGKTVAAGEGTEIGDCIAVGQFKAFGLITEELAGIQKQISTLEQFVEKLVSSGGGAEESGEEAGGGKEEVEVEKVYEA